MEFRVTFGSGMKIMQREGNSVIVEVTLLSIDAQPIHDAICGYVDENDLNPSSFEGVHEEVDAMLMRTTLLDATSVECIR